ncbi:MAG: hypothetical protein IJ994_02330, partial [Firmicutes bacterium]|nr:hypothetical protein [Bacillota bacterium]
MKKTKRKSNFRLNNFEKIKIKEKTPKLYAKFRVAMAFTVPFYIRAAKFRYAVSGRILTITRTSVPLAFAKHHLFCVGNLLYVFGRCVTRFFAVFQHFFKYSHFLSFLFYSTNLIENFSLEGAASLNTVF